MRGEHETDRPVRPSSRLLDRYERETVGPFRHGLACPNYESELLESREGSYPGYSGYQPRPHMSVADTKPMLPKLYLHKFKGDITKFTAFWDSFKSSVDDNRDISVVDKSNYLHSLSEGETLRAIQGLPLTAENYKTAVDTLHYRFGKSQQVIATHMDELLKLSACQSVDRIGHLRYIFDQLNIHVHVLEALGVNSQQYGSLLIPIVMSKVPAEIRLIVARKTEHKVWELQEILETLKAEVEARELSIRVKTNENFVPGENRKPISDRKPRSYFTSTAATFINRQRTFTGNSSSKFKVMCVFCDKPHYSASCEIVKNVNRPKEIMLRDARCRRDTENILVYWKKFYQWPLL